MAGQTMEAVLPLLELLPQPAFLLGPDGSFFPNAEAGALISAPPEQPDRWMGPLWAGWQRTAPLELPLLLQGERFTAACRPLADGTLVLLTRTPAEAPVQAALATAAQVLRQPLSDLTAQLQLLTRQLEKDGQEALLDKMAAMNRQIYRMVRLSGNLADLQALCGGTYHLRLQLLDMGAWLREQLEEAQGLCTDAGRPLDYQLPQKSVAIYADPALLERLLYNLLSNAVKYGAAGTPILCRAEVTDTQMLLQLRNQCDGGSQALLTSAFSRLQDRGNLPDPRWGAGLGLPLALAIARLHGGTVAVETPDGDTASVTVSLPRRKPFQTPLLEALPPFSYSGGMRRSLVELSDCLPNEEYHPDGL